MVFADSKFNFSAIGLKKYLTFLGELHGAKEFYVARASLGPKVVLV